MSNIYRPTIRMSDAYQQYVNAAFHATTAQLDRNQILRLAVFSAPFSAIYQDAISPYLKPGQQLPAVPWRPNEWGYWLNQTYERPEPEAAAPTIRASIGSFTQVY
jgi:hypothetical protein